MKELSKERVWAMCCSGVSKWKESGPEDIEYHRMLGMTNVVLCVKLREGVSPAVEPRKVLLRIFPEQASGVVNKKKEQAVFEYLSRTEIGVKMYFQCDCFRVEEFLEAEHVTTFELNNKVLMRNIAFAFCQFNHDRGLINLLTVQEGKKSFAERFLTEYLSPFRANFEFYCSEVKTHSNISIMKELHFMTTSQFEKEYCGILDRLKGSEMIASHCDVHELNILRFTKSKAQVKLIDYEYCSPNFRSIDLATLWMESAIDYTHPVFPFMTLYEENKWDDDELAVFLKAYLEADGIQKGKSDIDEYVQSEYPILLEEVYLAQPLVCAMWSVWAILVANWKQLNEAADWNFAFALIRYRMYQQTRDVLLPKYYSRKYP
eukprot:TRINITY_DN18983_c0_g1_i2.p1 TRINITY_DN18983_c0_g1~~TRINITY_DN18983_c0_g1_i2.p1  ORF type:complete len:375 (+),score=40.81 TRINITY_DN18983_c0_g1_i2:22-1146(+)